MITKKIQKKDKLGKRLFVEITKKLKKGNNLNAGNEVIILSIRKWLKEDNLNKLVGKHLKYYLLDEHENLIKYEGILKENHEKYWDYMPNNIPKDLEEDYLIDILTEKGERKFVLLDKPYTNKEEEQAIVFFDDLFNVIDLEIKETNFKQIDIIQCSNIRCKKDIPTIDKYCKHCGQYNPESSKRNLFNLNKRKKQNK